MSSIKMRDSGGSRKSKRALIRTANEEVPLTADRFMTETKSVDQPHFKFFCIFISSHRNHLTCKTLKHRYHSC